MLLVVSLLFLSIQMFVFRKCHTLSLNNLPLRGIDHNLCYIWKTIQKSIKYGDQDTHNSLSKIHIFHMISGWSIIYSSIYDMSGVNDLNVFR